MPTRIRPTKEHLERAFARVRRNGWPSTMREALADPVRAALVYGQAVHDIIASARPPKPRRRRAAQIDLFPPEGHD